MLTVRERDTTRKDTMFGVCEDLKKSDTDFTFDDMYLYSQCGPIHGRTQGGSEVIGQLRFIHCKFYIYKTIFYCILGYRNGLNYISGYVADK